MTDEPPPDGQGDTGSQGEAEAPRIADAGGRDRSRTGPAAAAARPGGDGGPVAIVDLRLLATSDLHMHLLAEDGQRLTGPRPAGSRGLEGLAPLVARLRGEAANALLFDNGDLLQGNALADHLGAPRGPWRGRGWVHPAIACLNAMGYDAAAPGNHDFSYGAGFLARVLAGAHYPVVVANARLPGVPGLRPSTILRRQVTDRDGAAHALRIGVTGFVPPQTAAWEAVAVPGLQTEDVVSAARREVGALRAAGVDLIVALVHGGVRRGPHVEGAENAAAALAALPGIDAVVAGHVHEVIPAGGRVVAGGPGDPAPLVMPGVAGSHLGVIDLVLEGQGDGPWSVRRADARALAAAAEGGDAGAWDEAGRRLAQALRSAAGPAQAAAARAARVRVGATRVPLSSHLAMLGQDAGLRLVAMAQRWRVRQALAGGPHAGLPVVVAAAPFRAGGRAGPGHYTDLPAGPLRWRDLAEVYAFANRSTALIATGADLADWLERAAGAFRRIAPGRADQPLLEDAFPAYHFDQLDGLSWQVDLSQPARYDPEGRLLDPDARRITGLRHRGAPVAGDQRFILAANDYRLSGVGLYGPLVAGMAVVQTDSRPLRDVLADYLRRSRVVLPDARPAFAFARVPGATALLRTAPGAAALPGTALTPLGIDAEGFLNLRLDLDPPGMAPPLEAGAAID